MGISRKKINKIKQQEGPDLHVYGSANLVQTLLKHDLVDALAEDISDYVRRWKTIVCLWHDPSSLQVTESVVTSKGVIVVNYERAGAVTTRGL
jgi:hypothetical protein